MYVHVGNDHAKEGFRDLASTDPEKLQFRPMEGERITEIVFPEGMAVDEAFNSVLAVLQYHMEPGTVPAWIESDNRPLKKMLLDFYGLTTAKGKRPKTWGKDSGADKFAESSPHLRK